MNLGKMKYRLAIILGILLILPGVLLAIATPVFATVPASITINVPSQPVNPGDSVNVTLTINNSVAIFGWQLDLNYDSSKLTYNSLTEGTFLKNNGTTLSPGNPDTSIAGTVGAIAYSLGSATASAPPGTNGLLVTLNFTVKTGVSGAASFSLAHIILMDTDGDPIQFFTSTGASLTIAAASTTTTSTTPTSSTTTTTPTTTTANSTTTPTTTTTNSTLAPTITGFSPSSGGTGTTITITGTNFNGTTSVKFGGSEANDFSVVASSGTEIIAVVGAGSSGAITVITPHGTATSSASFTFNSGTSTTSIATTTSPTISPTTTSTSSNQEQTPVTTETSTSQTNTTDIQSTIVTLTPKTENIPKKSSKTMPDSVQTIDISNLIDTGGVFQDNFEKTNIGSGSIYVASLFIQNGTRALDKDGYPLESLSIQPGLAPPQAPQDKTIISTMDFEPDGAEFSQPIDVVYQYDPSQLPQGVSPDDLTMVYFDTGQSQWVPCDCTVNAATHQITAHISHFSLYAILGSNGGNTSGVRWSLAGIVIISELLIGVLIVSLFLRRKPTPVPVMDELASTLKDMRYDPARRQVVNTKMYTRPVVAAMEAPPEAPPKAPPKTEVSWDDLLSDDLKHEGEAFRTQLIITGGEITIPGKTAKADIELINSPNSRIVISVEYDPESNPRCQTKILIQDSNTEYQKSKETRQ